MGTTIEPGEDQNWPDRLAELPEEESPNGEIHLEDGKDLTPVHLSEALYQAGLDELDDLVINSESQALPEFLRGKSTSLRDHFPDSVEEPMIDMLADLGKATQSEDPREAIRDLMSSCDTLMEKLTEDSGELPDVIDRLDDRLWSWFQDPPETDTLREEMNPLLRDLLKLLVNNDTESTSEQSTDTSGASEPQESDDKEENTDEESTEAESSGDGDRYREKLEADAAIVSDFLIEANEQLEMLDNLLVDVEEDPSPDTLNELFRAMHTLKGGFGFCGLEKCTDLTHAAEDLLDGLKQNPPAEIPAAWMDLFFATMDAVRSICGGLEQAVDNEEDHIEVSMSPAYLDELESDLRKACDGVEAPDEFDSLDRDGGGSDDDEREDLGEETVNVSLDKISSIVDLVGELVISHSELTEHLNGDRNRELEKTLNQQEKILDQLQRDSMEMRMLPVKKEFNKFPRIVRDLSRELDKEINLTITGADTEIDKSVLDALHGPLVHLVRNAADHGIESPEERRKAGKAEEGELELKAYHESGNVYIEVSDDGAGLPRDVIEQKAIERGVIEEDHDLDDDEIDRLIFRPGFSTTDEVSDVSGRGVGMDVVASEIEELRGRITIDSTPGEGSTFTIELPLTVAIIDGLIARMGEEKMIFPVSQVAESINPNSETVKHVQGKGRVVQIRDRVIPLIDLGEFVDFVDVNREINDRTIFVVIKSQRGQFAVRVDKLLSHEQVVIKSLEGRQIEQNNLISGGAILGDGTVGLILDVSGVVEEYEHKTNAATAKG